jgi:hypothetical protein
MKIKLLAAFCLLAFAATSGMALPEGPPVCAWASEPPCPTSGDCGFDWDGSCCIPHCPRPLGCLAFCLEI